MPMMLLSLLLGSIYRIAMFLRSAVNMKSTSPAMSSLLCPTSRSHYHQPSWKTNSARSPFPRKPLLLKAPPNSFNLHTLSAVAASVEKDRKSTRLNSSHTVTSYAVFSLDIQTASQPRTHCDTEPGH